MTCKNTYGLVGGQKIRYSLSPIMHNASFKATNTSAVYNIFQLKQEDLKDFIGKAPEKNIRGLNVTIPFKVEVMQCLDEIDADAELIGAVNTIRFDKIVKGYNTDGVGCLKGLEANNVEVENRNVLVLGAGGAARAIIFTMARIASVTIANRTIKKADQVSREIKEKLGLDVSCCSLEELEERLPSTNILINATSVGMREDKSLVPKKLIHSDLVVNDIVYAPLKTRLLRDAEEAGAQTVTGINMLVYQGVESQKIWGLKPDVNAMKAVLNEIVE